MMRFATLQLSDAHLAEDAVQEALLGAMKNVQAFEGRAAFKTWMFAILRHKIADLLRQKQRAGHVDHATASLENEDQDLNELFDAQGHWNTEDAPQRWSRPHDAFQDRQFWMVFETCLDGLPGAQARAFMMREFVGLETEEICQAVGVANGHLHVLLHRARLRLRECLETRWFDGESPSC